MEGVLVNPQDTPQTQSQDTEAQPAIEAVVNKVADDSRRDPQQYLEDTVVPHGGE